MKSYKLLSRGQPTDSECVHARRDISQFNRLTHWLHCCIVSYQRRSLTEATVESFLSTVSLPHSLVIVDNGSGDDVIAWLNTLDVPVIFLGINRYPGFSTNRGWEQMPEQTTLLMRSDNDTCWLPGWCDEMIETFDARPEVGQYGPVAAGDEEWTRIDRWPVGGNSIIRRELWDAGLRYDERPWPELDVIEEHRLTMDVWEMGRERAFGTRPGLEYLDDGDVAYVRQSHADRGIILPE